MTYIMVTGEYPWRLDVIYCLMSFVGLVIETSSMMFSMPTSHLAATCVLKMPLNPNHPSIHLSTYTSNLVGLHSVWEQKLKSLQSN